MVSKQLGLTLQLLYIPFPVFEQGLVPLAGTFLQKRSNSGNFGLISRNFVLMVGDNLLVLFHPFAVVPMKLVLLLEHSGEVRSGQVKPFLELIVVALGPAQQFGVLGRLELTRLQEFGGVASDLLLNGG